MLIEMACKNGDYLPELSFGTHFFQDLVEASIRYLPLYPDDENITFNHEFFLTSENIMADLVPDFAHLAGVIRVIDIPQVTGGQVMQILMNADQMDALALLSEPEKNRVQLDDLGGF
jgi:pyruvate,water dikinase